ncbi:unnamed protein product [Sphagnum balticum]
MSLLPLPAGWDSDRIYSTNEVDEDYASLPASDQQLIQAWRAADAELMNARLRAQISAYTDSVNASRSAAGLNTIEEADRAFAEEMGIKDFDPVTQGGLFDVATQMKRLGAEAWGFVVFKTWGYKDGERERWDEYWRKWEEVMQGRLRDMGAKGDLKEGITGKLLWWLVDEVSMDGKGVRECRECMRELVEEAEEHIPLGVDLDLCLVVDRECVDSLLEGGDEKAWVWGVDVDYGDDDDEEEGEGGVNEEDGEDEEEDGNEEEEENEAGEGGEGEGRNPEYPGHFKISVSVLMPELWHTLDAQTPDKLYPSKGMIYGGIVGNFAEAFAR